MDEIAKFIKENEITHDWRDSHFYIWPSYYEMDDLKEIIPWGMTEYGLLDGCAITPDGVCIDLLDLFSPQEVERHFRNIEAGV